MCLLILPKHICKNALLGERNLVKVIKNGTKFFIEACLRPRKLNIVVKTKLVLFLVI
jgi:hypothetical protein